MANNLARAKTNIATKANLIAITTTGGSHVNKLKIMVNTGTTPLNEFLQNPEHNADHAAADHENIWCIGQQFKHIIDQHKEFAK